MGKTVRLLGIDADSFVKKFRLLAEHRALWEAWSDFVTLAACAISNAVDNEHFEMREKQYLDTIHKYKKSEQELFPELLAMLVAALDHNPDQDFLGELYMALELGNHWKGQFFTPYDVTKAMAVITYGTAECLVNQIETQGVITVNDCACGAGATLIAAANTAQFLLKDTKYNWQYHFLFTAQDIDPVVAKMCYIQLSLLGCAGFIKIGDSLVEPMCSSDDKTNYWYTPMYFHRVWTTRRMCRAMDKYLEEYTTPTNHQLPEDQPAPAANVQEEGHKEELGKKYCRYCAYCIAGDAYYCNARDKVLNRVDRVTDCPDFVLSALGDVDTGKPYNPRGSNDYGTLDQQSEGEQLTLF